MSDFASKLETADDIEEVLKCASNGCGQEGLIYVRTDAAGQRPAGILCYCKKCAFRALDAGGKYFGLALNVKTTETAEREAPKPAEVTTTKTVESLGESFQEVLFALARPR